MPSVHQPDTDKQKNRDFVIRRISTRLISLTALCVIACLAFSLAACGGSSVQAPGESTENGLPEAGTETPVQSTGNPGDEPVTAQPLPQDTDDHSSATHAEIIFTSSDADIWPPQPVNVTNVTTLLTTAKAFKKTTINKDAMLADADVRNLAGDRFEILTRHEIKNKAGVIDRIETEIYAYQTNQIVTVSFNADTGTVTGHTVADAFGYQPPESQAEAEQAIVLAEAALSRQGFTDHLTLRGTGLLAHPTAIETAESGHQFYSERKIYVTFGHGNGELPQYRALVNLSNSTVEHSGAIQ